MSRAKENEMKPDKNDKGKDAAPLKKKRSGIFAVYRSFLIYVIIAFMAQGIMQLLMVSFLKTGSPVLQNIVLNLANVAVILFFAAAFGYMYYRKLQRVTDAIDTLAQGGEVSLDESGVTADLAKSINMTSDMLRKQREIIERRDNARSEWIRGVSHDIRTPLSIVMGYAEALEDDEDSCEDGKKYARIIKEQSIKMRDLIEDLNLAMKLEYNKQPLRLSEFSPAALLREAVGALMDSSAFASDSEGGSDKFDIELIILPEFEKLKINADRILIRRVIDNILGNSIRHNPAGCHVLCFAYKTKEPAIIEITDDGVGIPEDIASAVNSSTSELTRTQSSYESEEEERVAGKHIMGLRIAKQIMLAHGGNLIIRPDRHTVQLIFL